MLDIKRAVVLALSSTAAVAQSCISLKGSTTCPAFNASSVSTSQPVVNLYPFLSGVTNVQQFDQALAQYVKTQYVQTKYVYIFGCQNVDLSNTTDYYARYTLSFICNGVVQNSRTPCGLSGNDAMPLCADSCAQLALSESNIISTSDLCSGRNSDYASELRADFVNCALPANSISGTCITGESNEPNNCGFSSNLLGLCNYCRASTLNGTDSCCLTSNATGRCTDVTLPAFSSVSGIIPSSTSSSSPTASSSGAASSGNSSASGTGGGSGLSGGAIAGIVIGSVVGFLVLLALIWFFCVFSRRRRREGSSAGSLNRPTPQRIGEPMMGAYNRPVSNEKEYEVLPGGRVARMAALSGTAGAAAGAAAVGAAGGSRGNTSGTDPYGTSPESNEKTTTGGMTSGASKDESPQSNTQTQQDSSGSGGEFSSPEGVGSGQSEQLPFFKDYYSQDDIHPGDLISVLWAYQPRAGDEFELERGDMLKVVGIWDDGWATGTRVNQRAEDYDGKDKLQRDSVVSGGIPRDPSPTIRGEVKAFPLVCVCLPEAWKKTVEGDSGDTPPGTI